MTIKGHLDLFSGIGGFSLALKNVGIEPDWIGFSDIDKHANKLFKRRFKNAEELGDVSTIRLRDLPKNIDLLTGGFPCQPFSIAGNRLAFEDTRGTLFYEIVRILKFYIQEGRAIPHFVLENVKGLYSAGNRSVFSAIYKILTDIGYSVECELLNSKYFGVPQNRERIYLVGRHTSAGGRPKVFPITGNDKKYETKKINVLGHSGSGGYRGIIHSTDGIVGALSATDYKQPKQIAVADYRNDEGLRIRKELISPCLPARRTSETDPSTMPPLIVTSKIRRLTPIECERLQGFPDNWTEGQSNTQRYKQCGNAITVNVAEVIFNKLYKGKK